MLKKLILLCFMIIITPTFAKEPQNLDLLKKQIIQYHDSGEYLKDISTITASARAYLSAELKKPHSKKLAIVLDIDETSLSNYADMRKYNFGGTDKEVDDLEGEGHDPAIKPTLDLYHYALKNNITVFFVTGRSEKYIANTENDLKNAGFTTWNQIYMAPKNYHEKTYAIFKTSARKKIEDQGYEILFIMGDQETDLIGGHADRTFKLPNPFYLVS